MSDTKEELTRNWFVKPMAESTLLYVLKLLFWTSMITAIDFNAKCVTVTV